MQKFAMLGLVFSAISFTVSSQAADTQKWTCTANDVEAGYQKVELVLVDDSEVKSVKLTEADGAVVTFKKAKLINDFTITASYLPADDIETLDFTIVFSRSNQTLSVYSQWSVGGDEVSHLSCTVK